MNNEQNIEGLNEEALNEELRKGGALALALVDHLRDMGGAATCTLTVADRSEEYVVCVMPKWMFDQQNSSPK